MLFNCHRLLSIPTPTPSVITFKHRSKPNTIFYNNKEKFNKMLQIVYLFLNITITVLHWHSTFLETNRTQTTKAHSGSHETSTVMWLPCDLQQSLTQKLTKICWFKMVWSLLHPPCTNQIFGVLQTPRCCVHLTVGFTLGIIDYKFQYSVKILESISTCYGTVLQRPDRSCCLPSHGNNFV